MKISVGQRVGVGCTFGNGLPGVGKGKKRSKKKVWQGEMKIK